ncbi:hypothetical protein [Microbacterium rhizophilus]|uniref:hypothetical protein n=1 Tax=Microbacterium rhizophilus TaxID=3138934 RepID=UPI0031E81944
MTRARRAAILRHLRQAAALAVATTAMLALSACAPDAPQGGPSAPATQATGEPAAPDAEPTCETIVPATLVADFEEYGLQAMEEPFAFGDPATTTIPDGIMCTWGNPEVATDHGVQLFGWAPLDAAGQKKWTAFLAEQGWTRSEGEGLIYLSDPFEGVEGMTYAFGDGFVVLADTKQSVALVTRR